MPVNGDGKFDYPEQGWSTGNMRTALTDKLPVEPTPSEKRQAKGSIDYDILTQQIGPEGSAFIKRFDEEAKRDGAHPELKKNWEQWRQFWIQRYQEGQGTPTPTGEQSPFPKVAKMLPTSNQATQVLEQAASRQKRQRKEAEAM
jgi:hypothetical protein